MILLGHSPSISPSGGQKGAGEDLDTEVQILLRIVTISWGSERLETRLASYSRYVAEFGLE